MKKLIVILIIIAINLIFSSLSFNMETLQLDKEAIFHCVVIDALGKIGDKEAVKPLISALKDKNPSVRIAAAGALGKIGDKRAIEPLKKMLEDKYIENRKVAAINLGKLSYEPHNEVERTYFLLAKEEWSKIKEIGQFISDLKSIDPLVCREAVEILGKIADRRSAIALIHLLKDKEPLVRKNVAKALGKIKDKSAIEPLIEALNDRDWEVRANAAEALGEIKDTNAIEPLYNALQYEHSKVRIKILEALAKMGDKRVVEPLITVLKKEREYGQRMKAVELLGNIGDKNAIPLLVFSLRDESPQFRKSVALALEKLNWEPKDAREKIYLLLAKRENINIQEIKEIGFLISDLEDNDPSVRWMAAEALSLIVDTQAIDSLIKALKDENYKVRMFAVKALGKVKNDRAMDALISCLKDEKSSVRLYAAQSLGNLGNEKAIAPLLELISKYQWQVELSEKREIAIALEKLGWEPKNNKEKFDFLWAKEKIPKLTEYGYSDIGYEGDTWSEQKALEELEKEIDFFNTCLKNENSDIRTKAALILAAICSNKAISSLKEVLEGEESTLQSSVIRLLDKKKIDYPKKRDKRRIDDLIKDLKDESFEVRINAAVALGEIGDKKAVKPLIKILEARNRKTNEIFGGSIRRLI